MFILIVTWIREVGSLRHVCKGSWPDFRRTKMFADFTDSPQVVHGKQVMSALFLYRAWANHGHTHELTSFFHLCGLNTQMAIGSPASWILQSLPPLLHHRLAVYSCIRQVVLTCMAANKHLWFPGPAWAQTAHTGEEMDLIIDLKGKDHSSVVTLLLGTHMVSG